MAFTDDLDMTRITRRIAHFFAEESCGKCAPCRVGTKRMMEILDRLCSGQGSLRDIDLLEQADGLESEKDAHPVTVRRCLRGDEKAERGTTGVFGAGGHVYEQMSHAV